jgi:ferredoxin
MAESVGETLKLVRFMQGAKLLGQTRLVIGETLVEHAESAGVNLPTNCTSGTCGTCMVTLIRGKFHFLKYCHLDLMII